MVWMPGLETHNLNHLVFISCLRPHARVSDFTLAFTNIQWLLMETPDVDLPWSQLVSAVSIVPRHQLTPFHLAF